MSFADRLGLPGEFQTTLLLLSLLLTASPYLAGVTIGGLKIPELGPRQRRLMRFLGPAAFLVSLGLVVPVDRLAPAVRLELLAADATEAGLIDLVVANQGTEPALLTRIALEVVSDDGTAVRPALAPAAGYRIPIADLRPGQQRSILVRHLVPAGATERILISPETIRATTVRVHVHSARAIVLSRDVRLWRPKE